MAASAIFDRVVETTTTTGTGTLTLAGAVTGYRTFAAVGDGNTTPMAIWEVDADGIPSGAWEVAAACTYTSAGTTLTRGTFLASSTGSAINFGAGTKWVAQSLPAALLNQAVWRYEAAPADGAIAAAVNVFYLADISGYSASRTLTLPATAAVGDRVGVLCTVGHATLALLLTATAGDTLNGVAGGTEWNRLLVAHQSVILRCIVANTTWVAEHDNTIALVSSAGYVDVTGDGATTTTCTATASTKIAAAFATVVNNALAWWDTTNKKFLPLLSGRYVIGVQVSLAAVADGKPVILMVYKNGAEIKRPMRIQSGLAGDTVGMNGVVILTLNGTTDYVEVYLYNGDATNRTTEAQATSIGFQARYLGP
jgi:hypothetical protein